jgi:hypothetical protein
MRTVVVTEPIQVTTTLTLPPRRALRPCVGIIRVVILAGGSFRTLRTSTRPTFNLCTLTVGAVHTVLCGLKYQLNVSTGTRAKPYTLGSFSPRSEPVCVYEHSP